MFLKFEIDNYLATEFLSEREKYEENARKLTQSKAGKNVDALTVEFLGNYTIQFQLSK